MILRRIVIVMIIIFILYSLSRCSAKVKSYDVYINSSSESVCLSKCNNYMVKWNCTSFSPLFIVKNTMYGDLIHLKKNMSYVCQCGLDGCA